MKLHRQFDLNSSEVHRLRKEGIVILPHNIEEFFSMLSRKGYTILKSSSYITGIPQSITLIKDTTELIASKLTEKIRQDFDSVSEKAGIGKIFS